MKFLFIVLAAVVGMVCAPVLRAADLMTIYQEALTQDTQYRSARAAHQASQEKVVQGRAGFLPNITLSASRTVQQVDPNSIFVTGVGRTNPPEVTIQSRGVTLSATQPIFRMENIVIYQQSKIEVSRADAQFVLAAQDLILRVAQAYFDVLDAQIDIEVAEAQKKAILIQLEQAKRNFEVGVATIVDTNEAQARHDLTLSQEIAALNALEIRKRSLQGIIDRFPGALTGAKEIASDLNNLRYGSMDEWVKVAEEQNFTLKIQKAAYEMAQQDVKRAGAQHYPTLDLVAQYSDQTGVGGAITGRGIDLVSKSIGLQLNVPLFQGFSVQSRVREALALQERALNDLETTRRTITLQIRQQFLNVTNGIAQVKALTQALKSIQSQVDSTMLGQQVGVRTEVDVLNAQQQLYAAKRDLAKAYHAYLMARLRLSAEAGELDEDALIQINAMLVK
ncbi:channel protein TolC [Nitrosomonas sp. JL21]|uniref:TolC family outer membrane protein n=1 Tax=Nitrosomonas sp. JL21 TaxID=153949 RepID=UPI001369483A|nr:TolC family outer membrane protein [Nitrosomonas sp. JL21]MBL8498165.1 TolC family outer membrane protein [Nitrosomonas sp.]MXS77258.1 channel protein TolC [Nitrosomonas sp. JL21]